MPTLLGGVELGYKNPVFFERHAVGGEYSAGYKLTGKGKLTTTFVPEVGGWIPLFTLRYFAEE